MFFFGTQCRTVFMFACLFMSRIQSEMQQAKHVSKTLLRNTILQTDAHNRVC